MAEKQFSDFCEDQLEVINLQTARFMGLMALNLKQKLSKFTSENTLEQIEESQILTKDNLERMKLNLSDVTNETKNLQLSDIIAQSSNINQTQSKTQ